MSTWQIFSDDQNNFRWETTVRQLQEEEQYDAAAQQLAATRRLPSMADLLLLGCSELLENGTENVENPTMFRTGLGRCVDVKQSSMEKARSVLGDMNYDAIDAGHLVLGENGASPLKLIPETRLVKSAAVFMSGLQGTSRNAVNMSNTMFQTGSGKAVNISSAGLLRAKSLLGLEENWDQEYGNGFEQKQQQPSSTELLSWENLSHLQTKDPSNLTISSATKVTSSIVKSGSEISESLNFPDFMNTAAKPPPVKFLTASGAALKRAKSLLGNPECDSFLNEASTVELMLPLADDGTPVVRQTQRESLVRHFQENLKKMVTVHRACLHLPMDHIYSESSHLLKNEPYSGKTDVGNAFQHNIVPPKRSSNGALVDISNTMNTDCQDHKQYLGDKKRLGRTSSSSPFKRPKGSFVTPLKKNSISATKDLHRLAPKEASCKQRVSTRYPLQASRAYIKEYLLQPPSVQKELENLPEYVKRMNPSAAVSYTFTKEIPPDCSGPEAFYGMLSQYGASVPYLTKEWVANHYKWILWKLASYERCYPAKFAGKLLVVSNVLEELRYRYEREVNHGHRSPIKKILDGDAPPSSMMVLCISTVSENHDLRSGNHIVSPDDGKDKAPAIELTDGWYSMKALLDEPLSQKLASGKLFLGQKLRIWGAKLSGWVGPVSPFEAYQTTSLLLHMNGTYRCHWAERLGFCKHAFGPLAFRCIKETGGAVPSTLVGVTRIYPLLYREKLSNGSFVVRSERIEAKALQMYNQRRDTIVEGIISSFQREAEYDLGGDHESEEGAKLMKLLETAAEPEVLMAGMSSKELTSFASYKAKLESKRQSEMQKSIEKAVEDAGLTERDVTPFLRIKVVGLTNRCKNSRKSRPHQGLITLWNPTQKQTLQLCEGKSYAVKGLLPSKSDPYTLCLQARGSSSKWLPLSPVMMENFEPFFDPRSSTAISTLSKVPLSGEFDIAAFIVYVGDVYRHGHQQKQWVFVTDGSTKEVYSSDAILAINFCLPWVEFDSCAPVNYNAAGSVVGFVNLTKRPRDQVNGLWVAEATENSDYFLSYDQKCGNHLKEVAASVLKWANTSKLVIEKLQRNILSIIRNSQDRSR
ncbi:Protein BREAST CANCER SUSCEPTIBILITY 2 homolog B [Striga hermonthica]|uniref:Protein BREAST CANCER SUSCEPTIBILITY 2 homolog B n=1 Tax=Striga hermonthica TaxID=68872 RepID=A0A9N7NRE6_STRHE|nr:Protein BREAST CANCER SUSCEPTIBILITY 2 homolog B [Striga hermonthica]